MSCGVAAETIEELLKNVRKKDRAAEDIIQEIRRFREEILKALEK